MGFNSGEYIWFYLFALLVSWALIRWPILRITFLLVVSYYFYISHNHWLILLILASTLIDYFAALSISKTKNKLPRKLILTISIVSNLGILCAFKYFNFFGESVAVLIDLFGLNANWTALNILLPVGISFYTFQSMSYTIDVYREEIPAEKNWFKFALFVSYFPQLVAGPIVRAKEFIPQLKTTPRLDQESLSEGFFLIFKGFFKKVIIADLLAIYVDLFFQNPSEYNAIFSLAAVYAFAFQIYFDFSGYSDIAIGSAKLMGFKLPLNFNYPYTAQSLTDFWRKWHISLSTWLRDYLYIALGGNRKGWVKTLRNLMITMLLGGLWHGAAWTFVLWGLFHGTLLVIERIKDKKRSDFKLPKPIAIFTTFHLVCISWILFRSENMQNLKDVFCAFGNFNLSLNHTHTGILLLTATIILFAIHLIASKIDIYSKFSRLPLFVKIIIYTLIGISLIVFSGINEQPFIYFRF